MGTGKFLGADLVLNLTGACGMADLIINFCVTGTTSVDLRTNLGCNVSETQPSLSQAQKSAVILYALFIFLQLTHSLMVYRTVFYINQVSDLVTHSSQYAFQVARKISSAYVSAIRLRHQ